MKGLKIVHVLVDELGYGNLHDYVLSLIQSDVEVPINEEVEADLLKAMQSPASEMTPADWQEQRRQLIERYGKKAS